MSKWRWDLTDEDDPGIAFQEPIARHERGKMPVASDAKAKAASKDTWRGRRATKRIARVASGIRNRRQKRIT
jgi:hypothetical protein